MSYKVKKYTAFYPDFAPVLKFEKKCFGWEYYASDLTESTEETYTLDEETLEPIMTDKSTSRTRTMYFRRKSPYGSNFIFGILELISTIISFFRRLLSWFLWVIVIGLVVISLASGNWIGMIAFACIYGGLIVASIIIAAVARLIDSGERYDE